MEPLSQTPSLLKSLAAAYPGDWLDCRHADDVFSPREAMAHLLIVEAQWGWIFRIKRILDPAYSEDGLDLDEADYARTHSIEEILNDFGRARDRSLDQLLELNLSEEDLLPSVHDPEFGNESVQNQLAAWAAHDLYHMGQMFKSFAHRYREEIGPYQQPLNLPHFN